MVRKKATKPTAHNFLEGGFDLPKLEEKVLKFWKENDIFEKSLEKNKKGPRVGGKKAATKKFVFYEGPPYANGKPAIHHVLSRVVKDVILRYKTMRGYVVPRKAGWDTHGLPVEMAAEKALGLKSKRDIEKLGVKVFNEKAEEQVWIYKDEWERLTTRIGYWLDLKNAYVTYAPEYIETIWWTLAQIHKRKLLYKGHKVVPWCTRCGTALSSHELAQGYQDVVDNSAYIKFKLFPGQQFGNFVSDERTYVLSWTTTPWTLPGNVALAVGEEISYVLVRTGKPDRASYIVAKNLASKVFKETDFAVMGEFLGRRLVGLRYEPLFDVPALRSPESYKVHSAEFVTTTDGTGVVHTAVMYGEDDYALGRKVGLPEHHTVNEEGRFAEDVPQLAGEYVKAKETEEKIFNYLRDRGTLFGVEPYTHEYPFCWRCGTPVLYYARTSWFIAMSKLRRELMTRNKKIHWMPEHVRDGRFGEWLREAKDWNLSRERYWGAPLPIWECRDCGRTEVVPSLDELSRLAGGSRNNYWVMRHGEAENNIMRLIDSGAGNYHLTPRGKKQVEYSAKRFKALLGREKKKIDLIVHSDITRTKETAEITAKILGIPRGTADKRLEEIHLGPTLAGCHSKQYHDQFPTYESRFEKRPEGGESIRDLRKRVWEFLQHCESKYTGKNILLVSHEYPIWMLTHTGEGWSEKRAIAEKQKTWDENIGFIHCAEIRTLDVKTIPRNDTGEVDLHRPFADDIYLNCVKCGPGKMRRVREVADVWYDSGAMPFAQAHFPFSLTEKVLKSAVARPHEHIAFPADYIAEGMDQTRGWFYTLLAISTALGYEAPYRNVITFGLLNDKFGKKMSKSKGNIVEPFPLFDKYGVDAVRWYFYTGTPFGEPKNFDEQGIAKALREAHLIIYNSFVFWKTYAKTGGAAVAASVLKNPKNILDKWILARLNALVNSVTQKLDRYEIREAALEMGAFVGDLSRWYIRRSRRRLQRPESAADYEAASATLGYALLTLIKIMAPFTPFLSEILYGPLGGVAESVHLDEWPKGARKSTDKTLTDTMEAVRELAAMGLAKRAEAGVKVRQPLASLSIGIKLAKEFQKILADEVNVKEILWDAKLKGDVALDVTITPALREEGLVREIARMVQELRQKASLAPKDEIALMLQLPDDARTAVEKNERAFRADVGARTVEYRRLEKFDAEATFKLEEREAWVGLRKI
ncbi:MAG TPA: class I tRNA ligase family protein [Candidatus Paceibacterota bacterium]|nr:class I tRNA ligase family protein [Candidatus Paceibacterota bacterium]